MEDPTPIRQAMRLSIWSTFIINIPTNKEVVMVHTMTGRLFAPTAAMVPRFRENPRMITAHCRIFLDVNLIPSFNVSLAASFGQINVIIIPIRIPNTGAPIISKEKLPAWILHKRVAMAASTIHRPIPNPFFLIKFIFLCPPL